jgi:hypothetical protein
VTLKPHVIREPPDMSIRKKLVGLEIMYSEELWADSTFALFNIDEGYVYKSAPVELYIKRTALVFMVRV